MAAIPPFLNALDLDTHADERAIRRAYAKRLKRIDQETDPAAFQALRETFESALKWVAWQAKQNAGMPAIAPVARPVVHVAAPTPPPAPPIAPPRPTEPPALRVVRDTASASVDAPLAPLEWPTLPQAVAAPTPTLAPAPAAVSTPSGEPTTPATSTLAAPTTPRSRPPSAAPLPADTPTMSLLQDAKPTLARTPPVGAPPPHAPSPPPPKAPPLTFSAPAPQSWPQPQRPAAPTPQPALAIVPDQNPADLVFADFVQRFTRVADDEPVVAREIAAALADPRLVNLDARSVFEWHVASLIMGGWKPGHEFLFKPACDAFEWEKDRRRLEIYGPMGAVLDAAIRERLIFTGQPYVTLDPQRKLMKRLRTDKPLRAAEIAPNIQMLTMLLQRFPNWMRVMTRQDVVQHWIETWNAFTPEQRQMVAPPRAAPKTTTALRIAPPAKPFQAKRVSSGGGFSFFGKVWVVVMIMGAISRMVASSNSGTPAYRYQAPPAIPSHFTAAQIPASPDLNSQQSPTNFPSPYTGSFPAQGTGDASTQPLSPADEVRRQMAADRLERKQQQIDVMNAKRALREGQGSGGVRYDEQVVPVPDPNVVQGQAPTQ